MCGSDEALALTVMVKYWNELVNNVKIVQIEYDLQRAIYEVFEL